MTGGVGEGGEKAKAAYTHDADKADDVGERASVI